MNIGTHMKRKERENEKEDVSNDDIWAIIFINYRSEMMWNLRISSRFKSKRSNNHVINISNCVIDMLWWITMINDYADYSNPYRSTTIHYIFSSILSKQFVNNRK